MKAKVCDFVKKLREILDTTDPTILSWLADGSGFSIYDEQRFCAEICPEFFKHKNLSSFVRQLNFYQFKKTRTNYGLAIFSHEYFLRDSPKLMINIRRVTAPIPVNETNRIKLLEDRVSDLTEQVVTLGKRCDSLIRVLEDMNPNTRKRSFDVMQDQEKHINPIEPLTLTTLTTIQQCAPSLADMESLFSFDD
ncbi:MAG: heat shock factor family protein [Gammaproteobacteria bacterium]|nr:heat shock factor family protein [Gammaproteobacteria bacterium]